MKQIYPIMKKMVFGAKNNAANSNIKLHDMSFYLEITLALTVSAVDCNNLLC